MELLNYIGNIGLSAPYFILGFIFVITIIVFVHEMGHYLVARWCGIRVDEFSIGFGKELWGFFDKNGTRWKISLIPLGGYVKFWGDANEASFGSPEAYNHLSEDEKKHCFHTTDLWRRFATVAAGPLVNFILALVIFMTFSMFYGQPNFKPSVNEVVKESAAERAGVIEHDIIVRVNGNKTDTFDDVRKNVMFNAEKEIPMQVMRNGELVDLKITPEKVEVTDRHGNKHSFGRVGIIHKATEEELVFKTLGLTDAFNHGVKEIWFIITQTLSMLKDLIIGQGDIEQLGGPVKIAHTSGYIAQEGILPLVRMVALLSVGIGLFNLFPIPMLDGGHLFFYTIEAIIRKPVPKRVMEIATQVGVFLLFSFFIFVTINDIRAIL